ncbi:MAG TPA: FMN-binding protein [Rudaea sp.]|jgi:Na+-translocating ferredoxin:NAD+ oxidoreductase RnfG subunit
MRARWLLPLGVGATAVAQVAYAVQYLSVEQAQRAAFADATRFEPVAVVIDDVALDAPAGWKPLIWRVWNGDAAVGWFFEDAVIGKSELITYALALNATGKITNLEILEYRESHGGEVRLAAWRKQFSGKSATDAVALDRDIRNISGATLSCRHLTQGVHRLLQMYAHVLAAKP